MKIIKWPTKCKNYSQSHRWEFSKGWKSVNHVRVYAHMETWINMTDFGKKYKS